MNWCDAYAYCAGVGKRLCGKIGGGANGYTDYANATLSQWYAACTSNGTYSSSGYPYGNTYQAGYCNDNSSATVAVGTITKCQSTISGYVGVYDLTGNVWEWEDSCNGTGQSDSCRLRGGGISGGSNEQCGSSNDFPRLDFGSNFGFRCCSP